MGATRMKIALLFPGYGSQFVGMGKELYDEYRIVQEYFEEAAHVLDNNFVKLCFASSDAELSKLVNAYTALFLVGACVQAVLKEHDIIPDICAGYNNGEYAALFAANCFSLPDGLYLLHKLCSFYQTMIDEQDIDSMHVKGVATEELEKVCIDISDEKDNPCIALCNNALNHIVTGTRDKLSQLQDRLDESAEIEYCGAEGGMHSALMNSVIDAFKDYLTKVDFKDLKIPLISGIDGAIITQGSDVRERFITQINVPVHFERVMQKLADYDCILVATPADDLIALIKQYYPEKTVMEIAKKEDIDRLISLRSS
jgi:[acyl-carrier-protein] S-malonyltransferase